MRAAPAAVRASWPKPNYVDPVTRGPGLMIVELTLVPIALIVVCLRLWIRIGWLHKSWIDDWLILVGMVSLTLLPPPFLPQWQRVDADRYKIFSCLTTALVIMAVTMYGWNIHVWDATVVTLQNGRKVCSPVRELQRCHPANFSSHRRQWLPKHCLCSRPVSSNCPSWCLTSALHRRKPCYGSSCGLPSPSWSPRL